MGPSAGLKGCRKSRPHRDSTSRPSSPWIVGIPPTLSQPMQLHIVGIFRTFLNFSDLLNKKYEI